MVLLTSLCQEPRRLDAGRQSFASGFAYYMRIVVRSRPVIRDGGRAVLTKIPIFLLLALMALHLVKPLGWPGLRRRGDVWKIAILAIGIMGLAVLVRP